MAHAGQAGRQKVDRQDSHIDKVVKQQVSYSSLPKNDSVRLWDYSNMEFHDGDYKICYFLWRDSTDVHMMSSIRGARMDFRLQGDSLLLSGFHDGQTRLVYDEPETYLRYPMSVGIELSGYYHGRGTYCDKLSMRSYGRYTTRADWQGAMLLPEGDTLHHVLHLTTERVSSRSYYSITLRDSLLPFSKDSVMQHLATDTAVICTVTERWYAPGCRYPVLESHTASHHGDSQPYFTQALYYPPTLQSFQLDDNEKLLSDDRQLLVNDGSGHDSYTPDLGKDGNLSQYQLLKNLSVTVSEKQVTVRYELSGDATVKAQVCNVSGMVLRQASHQGQNGDTCELTVNCAGLRRGQYVLYLNVNGQVNGITIVV